MTSGGSTWPCTVRVASTSNGVDAHAVTVPVARAQAGRRRRVQPHHPGDERAEVAALVGVGDESAVTAPTGPRNARSVGSSLRGRPAARS